MILENRYNIPRETWRQLCKDGIVSSTVLRNYEIFEVFKKIKAENPSRSNSDIFHQMADDLHVSKSTIDIVVYTLLKIHK